MASLAKVWRIGLTCLGLALLVSPAMSQGLFSPVVTVNDRVVNGYQLDQRARFVTLLGVRENAEQVALNQLTGEALQYQTAVAAGFEPTDAAIEAGQAEFAARANLSRDQFIAAIQQAGVDPATFRDFVAAGIAWRGYVQDRFRAEAETLQPGAVERALETAELEAGRRVLLSEIILPANSEETRRVSQARAEGFSQLRSAEAFGEAAREFSLAGTRFQNGEVEWRPLSALPEEVASAVANLQPGQSSRPVQLDNAVAVFFVRDVEITPPTQSQFASVDYARLRLPGGAEAQAQQIAARLDRCEDLEAEGVRFSEDAYIRDITLLSALPNDIRLTLDGLDPGEVTTLRRNSAPLVIMLCRRTFGETGEIDATLLRLGLINERLQILANRHLLDLRDRAIIIGRQGG